MDLSPDSVHRIHGRRSNANPSEYICLAPTGGGQNRAQICELGNFFHWVSADW